MMKRLLVITLITLLLNAACTRAASDPPPTELPLNFPNPAPGTTPLCQPADLQTSSNSASANGGLVLGVTLTNQSKNPCALSNPPQVALLNGSGQPLEVQTLDTVPIQTPPAPLEIQLAPGESVIVSLLWGNYCQPLPNETLTVRVELALGGNLDVVTSIFSEPRCENKTESSTLMVAPYSYPP